MSVVVRTPDGKIKLYLKGAVSFVYDSVPSLKKSGIFFLHCEKPVGPAFIEHTHNPKF